MDAFSQLLNGFAVALTPMNLLWCLVGTTLGTAIGVLPGLGPALTIALLLPITFKVEPTAAFILFAGIYYGAMYGGSTTSILLNTPGESATIVTALEGHKMARNGRAGAALASIASTAASAKRMRHGRMTLMMRCSGAAGSAPSFCRMRARADNQSRIFGDLSLVRRASHNGIHSPSGRGS